MEVEKRNKIAFEAVVLHMFVGVHVLVALELQLGVHAAKIEFVFVVKQCESSPVEFEVQEFAGDCGEADGVQGGRGQNGWEVVK